MNKNLDIITDSKDKEILFLRDKIYQTTRLFGSLEFVTMSNYCLKEYSEGCTLANIRNIELR